MEEWVASGDRLRLKFYGLYKLLKEGKSPVNPFVAYDILGDDNDVPTP